MLPREHQLAQEQADEADQSVRAGDLASADELYSSAADLERHAFEQLPRNKKRTIGIIGTSVATLLYKASRFSEAEEFATSLLTEFDLFPSARHELQEVLDAIPLTLSIAAGGASIAYSPPPPPTQPFGDRMVRQLKLIRDKAISALDVEQHYLEYRTLLIDVATRKFKVPASDAESLAQDVFVDLLKNPRLKENAKAWLVAQISYASRIYWRSQDRLMGAMPEMATVGESEDLKAIKMTVRQGLEYMEPSCREILWLRYFEGRTVRDVAQNLEISLQSAEHRIYRCRKRLKEIVELLHHRPAT